MARIPHINGSLKNLVHILTPNYIKSLNQSEKIMITQLIENFLQDYNLTELDSIIDELLRNLIINDVFSLKIIYYKAKKELLCLNIVEANKFINLGLNKIKKIQDNDKKVDIIDNLFTIEKYKCDYLSGGYTESLEFYSAFEKKFNLDQLIKIEVSLNIGSIYLLTGDIQSCINIYVNCFHRVKQMEKTFLQVKISHLLGDYYCKIGNYENCKHFYKLSLSYSEDQNNLYYIGKNLVKLFILDYFQDSIIVDDFLLLKLKNYQRQILKPDFFTRLIAIHLSFKLSEKITKLKSLIADFNDQIVEPEILVMAIESLILFQLTILKGKYSEAKVDDLDQSISALENASKKYHFTFFSFKCLLLKSKIFILKQSFTQCIQILQDGINSAEKLHLIAYSKFFKSEIEKINLISPLYRSSKNNPAVADILHIQQTFQLIDLFNNFSYRLSLI